MKFSDKGSLIVGGEFMNRFLFLRKYSMNKIKIKLCQKNKNYQIIEYINGHTLENIQNLKLSKTEKITIIFEIIKNIIFLKYLYFNKYIHIC